MAMKKRTALLLFLASPQGQKMLKDAFDKLDTPKNRERLSDLSKQLKERAGAAKEKHAPAVKDALGKAKSFKLSDFSKEGIEIKVEIKESVDDSESLKVSDDIEEFSGEAQDSVESLVQDSEQGSNQGLGQERAGAETSPREVKNSQEGVAREAEEAGAAPLPISTEPSVAEGDAAVLDEAHLSAKKPPKVRATRPRRVRKTKDDPKEDAPKEGGPEADTLKD